jgi:hypothetical protein
MVVAVVGLVACAWHGRGTAPVRRSASKPLPYPLPLLELLFLFLEGVRQRRLPVPHVETTL